jgi:acyl-CoA synthetase (AMP-forming)/AMP-acid ligase II
MTDEFYPPISPPAAGKPSSSAPPSSDVDHFHIDFLPCFHAYGLQCQFVALYTATPRVVLSRFKLDTFLELVQEHKATFAFVVPPICEYGVLVSGL